MLWWRNRLKQSCAAPPNGIQLRRRGGDGASTRNVRSAHAEVLYAVVSKAAFVFVRNRPTAECQEGPEKKTWKNSPK